VHVVPEFGSPCEGHVILKVEVVLATGAETEK